MTGKNQVGQVKILEITQKVKIKYLFRPVKISNFIQKVKTK